MIRNIIFDWSGTLVDDLPAVWEATNYVFRQAGLAEMSLEQFRASFCLPFTRFYERFLPGVPMAQLEAWFHWQFKQTQHSVVELPHAREFLQFCRQRGLRTFLLSTVHHDYFAAQTAVNRFDEFLDRPYLGVWDKSAKIHELLAENHLAPDETLFVGDMQHDIQTARHGGIHSCAVLTGYNTLGQLRQARPDLIVEHLGELRAVLERQGLELAPPAGGASSLADAHPVVTVGALIRDAAGRVLLVQTHKWSNLWGIPGGKIKLGETAVDALRREIQEETGLDVEGVHLALVQDCIRSKEFYRDAHFVLLNYTCRCAGSAEVRLNDEAVAFRWVTPEEARGLELNTPTRRLLDAVVSAPSPA